MIPLRDVIPTRTTPWVTLLLISTNALMFLVQLALPADGLRESLHLQGLVPAQFSWLSAATALFMHSTVWHLVANLLALWILGENVEDRMGHARFLVFYLLTGGIAAWLQGAATPGSFVPMAGASAAIAGVMGAYLVLFPKSRVLVIVPLVPFHLIEVPAAFLMAIWFVMQLLTAAGPLPIAGAAILGVWAHIAGLVTGVGAVFLFRQRARMSVDWWDCRSW